MKKYIELIFGTESGRIVKKYKKVVEKINAREGDISAMTQEKMRELVNIYRDELKKIADEKSADINKKLLIKLDEILVDVFALVREAAKRTLNERHHDVQLIGGQVLFNKGIAEMRTGEGKTLVATLPTFLLALAGKGVHVVTVNDYLARRDAVWMGQVYDYLGLTVGIIGRDESFKYNSDIRSDKKEQDEKMQDELGSFKIVYDFLEKTSRKEAYACDITYGTNSEYGFDYLRDNLVYTKEEVAQRDLFAAIVDEVDSILIDESRTPLIISSSAGEDEEMYKNFKSVAEQLFKGVDFEIDEKEKQITLTEGGINKVEKIMSLANLFAPENSKLVHHLLNAIRAKAIYILDKDYVVKDGEIIIVDEFTGRLKPGTRWSEGLHQAVEAKERVKIQKESKTVASITYQNYFRMYERLAGMTGTASTSAEEFGKVYDLQVVTIPTNKEIKRIDENDVVYQTENAKWNAIVEKVKELQAKGQPVLIGTTSIEKNERMAKYFDRGGVKYEMLNAKNHEREGEIISQAGKKGSVVIATNMAGRGVDIKLGGAPTTKEEADKIRELGGLFVIGTERHEARRIDNQLRGRSGRQGDEGATQFFVSLDDEIMKRFGGDNMKSMMQKLNVPEDMPIEAKMVNRIIEQSQNKIEGFYFDMRKQVLQYDAVLNTQRDAIYSKRKKVLNNDFELVENYIMHAETIKPEIGLLRNELEEIVGKEEFLLGAKMTILQALDIHWMAHLDTMEHLRSSVSLRGYGQHDPLVEYKRESLRLFKEMELAIQTSISNYLFYSLKEGIKNYKTGVQVNSPTQNNNQPVQIQSADSLRVKDLTKIADNIKEGGAGVKEIGRNDPCPCGSGKKYKKCHGKDL
jgi:preprotein translocase subunit SecA